MGEALSHTLNHGTTFFNLRGFAVTCFQHHLLPERRPVPRTLLPALPLQPGSLSFLFPTRDKMWQFSW